MSGEWENVNGKFWRLESCRIWERLFKGISWVSFIQRVVVCDWSDWRYKSGEFIFGQ